MQRYKDMDPARAKHEIGDEWARNLRGHTMLLAAMFACTEMQSYEHSIGGGFSVRQWALRK